MSPTHVNKLPKRVATITRMQDMCFPSLSPIRRKISFIITDPERQKNPAISNVNVSRLINRWATDACKQITRNLRDGLQADNDCANTDGRSPERKRQWKITVLIACGIVFVFHNCTRLAQGGRHKGDTMWRLLPVSIYLRVPCEAIVIMFDSRKLRTLTRWSLMEIEKVTLHWDVRRAGLSTTTIKI